MLRREFGIHPPFMANAILNFHFDFLTPSLSLSMDVFSSIAVFCILCFDNHLATITSKKISNASMIIESKNPIILVHLVFFYGRRGDT